MKDFFLNCEKFSEILREKKNVNDNEENITVRKGSKFTFAPCYIIEKDFSEKGSQKSAMVTHLSDTSVWPSKYLATRFFHVLFRSG